MYRLIVLFVFLSISQSALSDGCKRLVFNKYCLGGNVAELEKEYTPARKRVTGKKTMLAYRSGKDIVVIQGFLGKVMAVTKISKPGSWLNYQNLKGRLAKIHGPGVDESYFPDYADSQSSKATSINLGEGRAKHLWKKEGWKIILLWSDRDSVLLYYIDEGLDKKYRSSNPEGL